MDKDQEILKEIRENFSYAQDAWKDVRDEAKHDMQCVAGDPWDPAERSRREDPKNPRPCLVFDELGQYLNQLINDVRDQKRAIQIDPRGPGSNDDTAQLRGSRIRQVEYQSQAQSAYITAFENAVSRSYGAFRINTRYVSDDSFEQEIVVRRIANPDTVWCDPDFKEADASDIRWCYVTDLMDRDKYRKEYPDAGMQNFSSETQQLYKGWVMEKKIQIAEYWKKEMQKYELGLLPNGRSVDTETLPGGNIKPIKTRIAHRPKVTQYITNGAEILESTDWLGKYIPIVMVFGKEIWVDDGSGSKRVLMSLVRLAREPYMTLCWTRSSEAELIRMTPKTPYIGYIGQFEGQEKVWQSLNDTPVAFAQVNPTTDAATGQLLPLPQRQPYNPAIDQLEAFAEACRRAIQSAMGIQPLPTVAQRQNEKSGVALQRIQTQTQKGSFHFVDNFERSLQLAGRIMNDLLKVEDTPREVGIRSEVGETTMQQVSPESYGTGDHEVTISTGPSFESERDQANQFVESIMQAIPTLPIPQPAQAQLLALAIKLKDLGPIGNQMVDIISPPADGQMPPQAMAAIQKEHANTQAMHAYAQQLEQELQKLTMEKQGKIIDNQARMSIEKMKIDAQLAVAEIETKSQILSERLKAVEDIYSQLHGQAHDVGLQKDQQAHEQQLASQQQQNSALAAQQAQEAQQQQPSPVGA